MAIFIQNIHSQAVDIDGVIYTSGPLRSGRGSLFEDMAWAIRFALPDDLDTTQNIVTATLNLYIGAASGTHIHTIKGLYGVNQILPSSPYGVIYAAGTSASKSLGSGTHTPALDYPLSTMEAWVAIDVSEIINEQRSEGWLEDGFVVFICQMVNGIEGHTVYAQGITQANPPTLHLEYTSKSPPPDPEEAQLNETLDNIVLNSEVVLTQIAELNETLDNILLEGRAFEVAKGSVDETLDNITLNSQVKVTNLAEVDETLDNIILNSEVYHGFPPVEASLDETLANVLLEAEAIVVGSDDADTDFRLFADHQLFPFNKHVNNIFA